MDVIDEAVEALSALMTRGKLLDEFSRSGKGEMFLLKYLFEKGGVAMPSEMRDALRSSSARISAALGSLEKKGFIKREIDLANRRNIIVTLTEKGREKTLCIMREMKAHLRGVLLELGEEDAVEMVRLSKRFLDIAQRHGGPPFCDKD
ncbi:MAG: MarR family winged helix-turn-helix transcriptional regulator [Clostridiales bacterium]|jgi:DNA-binding MarR family transcriptional regulator|nr:MarR family winged helix-turn-helix transcriptional regulator [Clostridiales bacterium]MDR2752140.1 MarR family winged helix-turn-helix transcriptional regulator [Clostridiales bacterium]